MQMLPEKYSFLKWRVYFLIPKIIKNPYTIQVFNNYKLKCF